MLIRPTTDATFECLSQEQHALLSGVLAGAWTPSRLDPMLVQIIGLHDTPWRAHDRTPELDPDAGLPHDFISYPMGPKIEMYREGIDQLEALHPYAAYLVSRHYTTFAGTRDAAELTEPEAERRRRLEDELADDLVEAADEDLGWIKFFDIFSLHLCLTGPGADPESIPRWLQDPTGWATAPDETELEIAWSDDATLTVDPWPFAHGQLHFDLHLRILSERSDTEPALLDRWEDAPHRTRPLALVPAR